MLRRHLLVGLIVLSFLLPTAVRGQGPVPKDSDQFWRVRYWNNTSLTGVPVIEETAKQLGFDWGYGSPHPEVSADRFSARWSRYLDLAEAAYRFSVTSDDGVRVYVDDQLIIDEWSDHPARTFSADRTLQAGHHHIVVEYYENAGVAKVALSWSPLPPAVGQWQGEYFGNRYLSGTPMLVRSDGDLNFDWGYGVPGTMLPADGFSARWTRLVHLEQGRYRFTASSDDGIRVYVDQRLLIDAWRDQASTTYSEQVDLSAGDHLLVVEYYENTGVASASLSWTPVSPSTGPWRGEYYANAWLGGTPLVTRGDTRIAFDWGMDSPTPSLPADGFSVRWTRTVELDAGLYRFTTTTDDGVRLWVNGHLLISEWYDQAAQSHSGTIHLSGDVPIQMEYYENGGAASAHLTWTKVDDGPAQPVGVVVVDDGDPGFVQGGADTAWHADSGGYGGRLIWTRNNDRVRPNYNWARWYPNLERGRYEVYVHIPAQHASSSAARYWVVHYDGYALRRIDQSAYANSWVSLGTYRFRGGPGDYVSLADVTYERYLAREIAFDAVKWVPR